MYFYYDFSNKIQITGLCAQIIQHSNKIAIQQTNSIIQMQKRGIRMKERGIRMKGRGIRTSERVIRTPKKSSIYRNEPSSWWYWLLGFNIKLVSNWGWFLKNIRVEWWERGWCWLGGYSLIFSVQIRSISVIRVPIQYKSLMNGKTKMKVPLNRLVLIQTAPISNSTLVQTNFDDSEKWKCL